MPKKINILIIGNGHYSTGTTILEGKKKTNTDLGVILPSILELKKQGFVDQIFLAGKNGSKFKNLRKKIKLMNEEFGWDTDITLFPNDDELNDKAYLEALKTLPKPAAVIISTPNHLHYEMILDTLRFKHHFMVVKPPVTKLEHLEDIILKQKEADVLGLVDYHKIYDDANILLKDQHETGKIGVMQHIFSRMTQRRDMVEIFSEWVGKDTNINHYLGSHYIHMVDFITNANPINVRATCQFGVLKDEYGIDTPDLIETQIFWEKNGKEFTSYHIAGWSDPSQTSAMTQQELHMIGTKGSIKSDQRFRGYETSLTPEGNELLNPYFFYLHKGLDGSMDLEGKYGFKSFKTFVKTVLNVENGADPQSFEGTLPTIKSSKKTVAILEAADLSMKNGSSIIGLNKSAD